MEAMTFHQAMSVAGEPQSRFFFGSPCRFIPRCDFTCHLLLPALLRKGDVTQQGWWDRGRVWVSTRLNRTSPRWKWLTDWNK